MAETFQFADDRPCVQLRVAASSPGEVNLTLLLDLWSPNYNKVMPFPWGAARVLWIYSAAPTVLTSHYGFSTPVLGGMLQAITPSWLPPNSSHVSAALIAPPLGSKGVRLAGVIDGYAGPQLFTDLSVSVDFSNKTTTVT